MGIELDPEKAGEILKGIRIPPQPQLLIDIQMEMAMPDFALGDIAALIAKDVGLSGAVLKTVNSPFFGMRSTITSIPQAISLLGLKGVVNVVNAVLLREALSGDDATAMIEFWGNASDVASACAVIAKKLGIASADESYTLGLFHNAAIPLLAMRFEDYFSLVRAAYAEETLRINEVESRALDTDHTILGYLIARRWQLPSLLCDAIATHHDAADLFSREGLEEDRKKNLIAILKIAEHLCGTYHKLGQQETDHEFEHLKPILLEYLGLTDLDLENLRDDLSDAGIMG